MHLFLYLLQVTFFDDNACGQLYIVVKPVFDGRSYAELHPGVEFLQSLCHKVRRGMPEGVFCLRLVPFV